MSSQRPYKSPAKSIRCTSILRLLSPKVGFGPMLIAAANERPVDPRQSRRKPHRAGSRVSIVREICGGKADCLPAASPADHFAAANDTDAPRGRRPRPIGPRRSTSGSCWRRPSPRRRPARATCKATPRRRHRSCNVSISPLRSLPKQKFGPSTIPWARSSADDDRVEELLRRQLQELAIGRISHHASRPRLLEQFRLVFERGEARRNMFRPQELQRMRIKRHNHGRHVAGGGQ